MTYKEFKEKGYSIEVVQYATVWSEVTINESESASYHNARYNYEQHNMEIDGVDAYRIISTDDSDEHAYQEFSSMDEVEEYINNEM